MENNIEHEICNNCKKEIPQPNYVIHTMHCARNITLCKVCKEPIPKSQFPEHEKTCKKSAIPKPKPLPPATNLEKSQYFQTRKAVEDKKVEARKERQMQKMDRLVDSGYSLKENSTSSYSRENRNSYRDSSSNFGGSTSDTSRRDNSDSSYNPRFSNGYSSPATNKAERKQEKAASPPPPQARKPEPKPTGMLSCRYCDLDLPKLELDDHENYCGTRTDKCLDCGELVMFKDKQVHMDSTHAGVKRRGGDRTVSWDSSSQRNEAASGARERPGRAIRPFAEFDYDPMPYLPAAYQAPGGGARKKEGESYKEMSRRLDCKTEYIRNILHDSAAITVPLRRSGTAPRNYFYHHEKDFSLAGSQPPRHRRRNPPTELVIPCEFCNVPIPHEDLVQHETGCRPDLARYNPRRRAASPDEDYYSEPARQPSVDDEDLPCEFCGDMIPASQLISHQIRCT
ncbi:unnamed protein product [Phyllotreta striolata]|uniref:TRAFD1/XAF1 zinc finger domain-containing protein n=1 Tax=Phyllotreta striolata TaxID=444603 RepID=A0A9N9TT43_PHYSR|nr:unnamed protein product [Phyllotreta striolata]